VIEKTKRALLWIIAVPAAVMIIQLSGIALYILAVQSFTSMEPLCRVESITYKDSQVVD